MINPSIATLIVIVGTGLATTLCSLVAVWLLERAADRYLNLKEDVEKALGAVRFYSDKLASQHVLAGLIPGRKKD